MIRPAPGSGLFFLNFLTCIRCSRLFPLISSISFSIRRQSSNGGISVLLLLTASPIASCSRNIIA